MNALLVEDLQNHLDVANKMHTMLPMIEHAGNTIVGALKAGKKVLLCGNGGSAADAQHIAAELVGRFKTERRGLPALALTTDTSILTAVGNDYGYDVIFARQVEALAQAGDVLIAYSTSGNSQNVINAVEAAKQSSVQVIGMLGRDGGKLQTLCDIALTIPAQDTAQIQEMHSMVGHMLCHMVDHAYAQ